MFRRFRTFVGRLCLAFTLGACGSAPKWEPQGEVVVGLEAATPVRAKARLLNRVVIELPPIERPGEEWTIVFNDERYLKAIGGIERQPNGSHRAYFVAVKPGRRPIRFFALQPHTRESSPTQIQEAIIEIE